MSSMGGKIPEGGGQGTPMNFGKALSAVSIATSLLGGLSSSKQLNANAKYNADILNQQASVVEAQKQVSAKQYATQKEQFTGEIIARTAASGLKFTGSPVDSLSASLTNLAIDQSMEQYNLEAQKQYYQNSAKLALQKGKQEGSKALFTGVGTALTQGADYLQKYWKPSQKQPKVLTNKQARDYDIA